MLTKVQKWGNSLALRIPKAFANDAMLKNNSIVEVSLMDGQIVIKPVTIQEPSLEEMLSRVTEKNLHHEVDTGNAIGNEIW